jgi:NADH:ubiquinone oxidoreductase subunit H
MHIISVKIMIAADSYFISQSVRRQDFKVGFVGIFQPFRDDDMLFSREQYFPLVSNYLIYYFSPIFGVFSFFIGLVVGPLFERFYFI